MSYSSLQTYLANMKCLSTEDFVFADEVSNN